jgi:hypothetical protein
VVIQGDALNRSKIATVVCLPLTSNLKWAQAGTMLDSLACAAATVDARWRMSTMRMGTAAEAGGWRAVPWAP